MTSRKHRKLKRHPIVRFIRGVFRLFRVLFGSKRTIARLDPPRPVEIEDRIAESSFDRDRLITVGELLGRVKWQSSPPSIQKEAASTSTARSQNAARN